MVGNEIDEDTQWRKLEPHPPPSWAVVLATIPCSRSSWLVHRRRLPWGVAGGLLSLAGMAVIFNEGLDAGVPLSSLVALRRRGLLRRDQHRKVKAFHVSIPPR